MAFIVEISTAEFEATGSVSTRRFQTFVRGRIGQRVMMRLSPVPAPSAAGALPASEPPRTTTIATRSARRASFGR
jgi:hypothetical protein